MAIFDEIQRCINNPDRAEFKRFLAEKLKENRDFLQHSWNQEGHQVTLLGYLISQHQETSDDLDDADPSNLTDLILETLKESTNIDAGFPLHQAISRNKLALAKAMIKQHSVEDKHSASITREFNFDALDNKARSLLSLALSAADEDLIARILVHTKNIHQSSVVQINEQPIEMQPIHQAIYLNLPSAVRMLREKAQLNNACGLEKNTPVMLAVKSGHCEVLEELLRSPVEQLNFKAKNAKGINAMGLACETLKMAKTPESKNKSLQNIAMLLCNGAEVPKLDLLKNVLVSHRNELLQQMDDYLLKHPELVDEVVNRIHDKNKGRLHSLVYENDPLVSILQHLRNKPNNAALLVENWITRKVEQAPASESQQDDDKVKFAEFVRQYDRQYKAKRFSNPWSSMRWMVASGTVTNWKDVMTYADNHPISRTAILLKSFEKRESNLHESMDGDHQMPRSSMDSL